MATTVRQDVEFGKDLGLIHEVIVTGRKVGADRDFWSTLAHNEGVFRQAVQLVTGVKTVVEEGDWFTFTTSGQSLLEMLRNNSDLFYQRDDPWWKNEKFAKQKGQAGRKISLRTSAVPDSFNKTWEEQQALLGQGEFVPTIRDVVDGMIQYFRTTGQRIFTDYYVRTQDVSSLGLRVIVGFFSSDGLYVLDDWYGYRNSYLGLSSARNS